jgi:hypothetical protein
MIRIAYHVKYRTRAAKMDLCRPSRSPSSASSASSSHAVEVAAFGMTMASHCPSGMLFLRCKDGISHNPAESIAVKDADLGMRALLEAARRLDRQLSVRPSGV